MNWSSELRRRFDDVGVSPSDDVVDELAEHAATAFASAVEAGATADAARTQVEALIDAWCRNPHAYARAPRRPPALAAPSASSGGLTGVWLDLRYGLRLARRQPGAVLLTLATIAVAVGTTSTLASAAYGVLARPLPWPEADRLVRVVESREGSTRRDRPIVTNVAYHSWLGGAASIDALAGFASGTVTIAGTGDPERLQRTEASAGLFPMLQTVPLQGRLFTVEDEREDAKVALVSLRLAQRRLESAESAIGRRMDIDGEAFTVVGVLSPGFDFPSKDTDVWTVMTIPAATLGPADRSNSVAIFSAIARLAPGGSAAQAAEEATRLTRQGPQLGLVGTAVFGSSGAPVVTVTPLIDAMTGEVRPALLMLLAGVGLLFATAVGGLTTLQVARWLTRQREVALRAAIGASRRRLLRQILLENLMVGLAGGGAGLLLAAALHTAAPSLLPANFPRTDAIVLDWRIAGLVCVLSVATSVLTSVLPIARATRLPLSAVLAGGGYSDTGVAMGGSLLRARSLVIVAQVAFTVVLLVGGFLVARSFVELTSLDRGYDPNGLLTARLAAGPGRRSAATRMAMADDVVSQLERQPGVRRVAYASAFPLMPGAMLMGFQMTPDGSATRRDAQAEVILTSTGVVEALGLNLVEGRGFDRRDATSPLPVMIVNRAFTREYLGARTVGVTLPLMLGPTERSWTIVGVVGDLAGPTLTAAVPAQIYMLASQVGPLGVGDLKLVARTTGDPLALVPELQHIVRNADAGAVVESVQTMADRLTASLAQPRLNALLLGAFAAFALLVAAVGLFGVLSEGVSARRREMGVRLALGATPRELVRLVVTHGLMLTTAGIVAGLAAAALLSGALRALLFGVAVRDPATYAVVAALVLLVAIVVCVVPARRAASTDVLRVLRD
jgi:predicted permease